MKVLTVKVVEGRLDLPEGTLQEGDTVTLLVSESNEEGFHLSEEAQRDLQAAIEEAERGESVDGWGLLDELASG